MYKKMQYKVTYLRSFFFSFLDKAFKKAISDSSSSSDIIKCSSCGTLKCCWALKADLYKITSNNDSMLLIYMISLF